MEITAERANQLVSMMRFLSNRKDYRLDYHDNSYRIEHGIQYIVGSPSYQLITLLKNNQTIAQVKQDKGIFTYKEPA